MGWFLAILNIVLSFSAGMYYQYQSTHCDFTHNEYTLSNNQIIIVMDSTKTIQQQIEEMDIKKYLGFGE